MVYGIVVAIAAKKDFVLLLKSFIANMLNYSAHLKTKFKCVYVILYSLVMNPFSCDFFIQAV